MKKVLIGILVVFMAISLIGSMASAQSTYTDAPTAPAPTDTDVSPPPASPLPEEQAYEISGVDQLQLGVGSTLLLTAFPEPEGTEVVWVSSNTGVATVQGLSPRARVTAVAPGTTDITVRALTAQEDGTYWEESVTIEVIGTALPETAGAASGSIILLSLLTMTAASAAYTRFKK